MAVFMEIKPMKDIIRKAIEALAEKGRDADKADDALKFTQAALNLAHTAATYYNMKDNQE